MGIAALAATAANAEPWWGYGGYGLGWWGKSAPCVNAANVPVPCAGKRKREAEAEADPYLVYGLSPVPRRARPKRRGKLRPSLTTVTDTDCQWSPSRPSSLKLARTPGAFTSSCPKKRRGKLRPRLSHTTVMDTPTARD